MMILQFLVLQILVFGAVLFFLKKILYGDTESAINRLGTTYQDLLKKQADLTQRLESAEKEYQAKREEALAVSEKLKTEAMDEARKKEDDVLKKARAQADEIVSKAHGSEEEFRREINNEVNRKMIDFVAELLKSVFDDSTRQMIHDELVTSFIARAKDMDLSAAGASTEMILRTAFPLRKEQTDKLNVLLVTKLNRPVTFHEVTDAELQAGLVMQFGTLLLEGALSSALKAAAEKAKLKF